MIKLNDMNELSTGLLEKARELKGRAENAYIELGVVLYRIEAEKAYGEAYTSLQEYASGELGLSKSTTSKLLAVGRFVAENEITPAQLEGASYTTTYEALQLHKGGAPGLILAEAKENTLADIRKNRRAKEPCAEHEVKKFCVNCWEEIPA